MAKQDEGMADASRRREKGAAIAGERAEGRRSNYEVSMERSGGEIGEESAKNVESTGGGV
ncbi:MAG: hypothetical protein Q9214_000926 [Letrouitia sp. 1 TL-2023]